MIRQGGNVTRSRPNFIIAAIAILGIPSASLAQTDEGCAQLTSASAPPGLYVKAPSNEKPIPVTARQRYDIDARFYFLPTIGPRTLSENQEAVYHVRSQTTAASNLRSDEALVYRPPVRTSCRAGQFVGSFLGDGFESFDRNSRYVSLGRYFDHHAENEAERRPDHGLGTYFHFEISDVNSKCFRTDDARVVGPLHGAYGFSDVTPVTGLIARNVDPVPSATAAPKAQSRRYAGLSSELVYVRGPGPACLSFNAPRPTVSSLRGQVFNWWRDDYAIEQAHSWRPVQTDIVIYRVPKGERMPLTILWQN